MADYVQIATPNNWVEKPKEYVVKERAKEAAARLTSAMVWSDTPEGDAFWRSVHDRLKEMAERGY